MQPETRYARSGEVNIAYQVVGEGPLDLVLVPGFVSHLDLNWTDPALARFLEHLASFSRLILFDKRGTGVSDPVPRPAPLEERMDDVRAVMDAAGSERAAMLGLSEGGPMSVMFATTYPERTTALVLAGSFVSGSLDRERNPGGPRFAAAIEELRNSAENWGDGTTLERFMPSIRSERTQRLLGVYERAAASPAMVRTVIEMNMAIDVSDLLPAVRVPTLVIHREDDIVTVENAHYMAERIPGARLVVFPGEDHLPWIGDAEGFAEEIEEFLTGARHVHEPERALATVVFTDIVGSTTRAAELGDAGWRELLAEHNRLVRTQLERFRGREVKTMGDGFLATFDGPARAVRCARAIADRVRELGIAVRAGVHTGECELLRDDVRGMAVNIGARIAELAGGGEVLVSSTVHDLVVGSGIDFTERGAVELKGVPGDWRLYAVSNGVEPAGAGPAGSDARELGPADRALVAAARRAPRMARSVVGRYRRGAHD
jgi:class 3 adenylate cyclase